jgi:hypothetical protein
MDQAAADMAIMVDMAAHQVGLEDQVVAEQILVDQAAVEQAALFQLGHQVALADRAHQVVVEAVLLNPLPVFV